MFVKQINLKINIIIQNQISKIAFGVTAMNLRHIVNGVWALVMIIVARDNGLATDFVRAVWVVEDSAG